jgi:hypothetical protein
VGHRYAEGGLEQALYEKERPGARRCWRKARSNGSSRWSVPLRRRVMRAGQCGWWPSTP